MSREVYSLNAGDERTVNRNSQWRTVSLKDIFEFASAKRHSLYSWHKHLLNWQNFDEAKKREIYDKECCHELNTFIKFKDADFFKRVVAQHISNKIKKTFVDYCLLDDFKEVKEYISFDKFNLLNYFEKTLFVYSLVQSKESRNEA